MSRLAALTAALAAAVVSLPKTSAAGEPSLLYLQLRYNGLGIDVRSTTGPDGTAFERKPFTLDLSAASLAVGIGYNGWNAQLDILNARTIGEAVLSVGYRFKMNFDNLELWVRVGAGPNLAIDYSSSLPKPALAGGVTALAEAGVHYFIFDRFGLGASLLGAPTFQFLGTRLIFEGSVAIYAMILI